MEMERGYLIARIPQVDGGVLRIYAASRAAAVRAREILAADEAMIDALPRDLISRRELTLRNGTVENY